MSTKNLFVEEIESEVCEIAKMQVGTEEYEKAVNGISKLTDKLNEMNKIDAEKENLSLKSRELDIREAELEADRKHETRKTCLEVGGKILAGGLMLFGMIYTWAREDEHVNSSTVGKKCTNEILSVFKK